MGILLVVTVVLVCFFGLTTKESRILMRSAFFESITSDPLYGTGTLIPDENGRVAFYRKMNSFAWG